MKSRNPHRPLIFGMILAGLLTALVPGFAWAGAKEKATRIGNRLFAAGQYDEAAGKYREALSEHPESPVINYDLGTTMFKLGDYAKAVSYLQKALLSEDASLRAKGYYNLGNAQYKYGISQEDADIAAAVKAMEEAVAAYDSALKIDDTDADARYNYNLAQEELTRLKKKQEQQQKQQQQKQQQQNQQQQNQQQNQQQQDQQQKNQQQDQDRQDQPQEKQQQQNQQQQSQPQENQQQDQQQQQNQQQQENQQQQDQQQQSQQQQENQQQQDQQQQDQQQSSSSGGQAGPSPQGPSAAQPQEGALNAKEADLLLRDYQRKEEPQGLLNFMKRKGRESPAVRDW